MGNLFALQDVSHPAKHPELRRKVFFTGSTAIKKGSALVLDLSPGTGKPAVGNCVKAPTATSKTWFAGVAAEDYSAKASGQWIEVFLPGSVCKCLVVPATTAGSTGLVFSYGTNCPFEAKTEATPEVGCGTALALESNTSTSAKLVLCLLCDGNDATGVAPPAAGGD